MSKRCEIGSGTDDPCREPAVAYYETSQHEFPSGVELDVCERHAHEAFWFGNGPDVFRRSDDAQLAMAGGDYTWVQS